MKGYIITIEFTDLSPRVWRRLVIPDGCTFRRLHETIQFATNFKSILGTDYHLYEFVLEKDRIRVTNDEDSYEQHKDFERNKKKYMNKLKKSKSQYSEFERNRIKALGIQVRKPSGIKIDRFLEEYGSLEYTYDFGDGWNILITLEDVVNDYYFGYPTLLDGEGDAPPEDVGGVAGFVEFLKEYKNPDSKHHNKAREWAKQQHYREYDPDWINHMIKAVKWKKTQWDMINHHNYEVIEDKYR
jgi:hypothetical protein